MQKSDLDELSSRPLRAIHADGISELIMGLTWLLWGALIAIPQVVPRGPWWQPYWIVAPILMISSGFGGQWLARRLKERWTYRRTGYVQPNPPPHGRLWAVVIIAWVTAAVIAGFMSQGREWLDLLPLGCSILVAAALAFGLGKQGIPGAMVYSMLCVIIGIALVSLKIHIDLGFAVLWGGLGLAMTGGGAWRLWRFVHSHAEVETNA